MEMISLEIEIRHELLDSDWEIVSQTLKAVGMAYYEPHVHKKAFENSHTSIFVYYSGRLIGFGRAISDGVYQAAIYDVAIVPEFQKKGIGTTIFKNIVSNLPSCNFILYTMPGKEGFYRKLGFRKMKTGMAIFMNAENMQLRGFTE
jgi:ribosomal protein S18 acetylase RimI-like enzyme